MEAFTTLTGTPAPLPRADVDTDIIYPARFLLLTEKTGLGVHAFTEWRYRADGSENPDFALNQPLYRAAPILVAGANFGCGSSREQAVWALRDMGIRAIIAPSFGEIFHANCFSNGIVPVVVGPGDHAALLGDAFAGLPLTIDLEQGTVTRRNLPPIAFSVPEWRRQALLNGWDEIDLITRAHGAAIADFETRQRHAQPWLYGD